MFGFGKKCPGCGMKVDEKTGFKKNGAVFCSESCALEFEKNKSAEKKTSGGCC